jgi:hypothetical protein
MKVFLNLPCQVCVCVPHLGASCASYIPGFISRRTASKPSSLITKHTHTHTLLEPRAVFFDRCQRTVDCFHQRHPYKRRQVFVMVSHAAGCVAMAKTLSKKELTDITPAGPCSIYMFSRTSDTTTWELDQHDAPNSMNGFTGHLSNLGDATVPWNNFGDGIIKFYTGPPTSRFAPTT